MATPLFSVDVIACSTNSLLKIQLATYTANDKAL